MGYAKGKVDAISIKERRSGQHGDFANFGIKLITDSGEQWFNGTCSADKNTNELMVKDKNYNKVEVGMTIEFMTVTNGNYENIDKKTLAILASGSASQPPQSTNSPQPTPNTTQQEKVAEKGDMDGFCDGLAKLIAAYKFQGKQMPPQEQIDRVANYIKKIFG